MTAIFIDTKTRALNMSAVSITQNANGEYVMRFAAQMAKQYHFPEFHREFDSPVIVNMAGYTAMSSAGFTNVIKTRQVQTIEISFVQGFPWMKNGALRRLRAPMQCAIVMNATMLRLETHRKMFAGASNSAVADAAMKGLETAMQWKNIASVVVEEGQSDYMQAWEFYSTSEQTMPAIEGEHESSSANKYWVAAIGKKDPSHVDGTFEEELTVLKSGTKFECENFVAENYPTATKNGIAWELPENEFIVLVERKYILSAYNAR